MVHFTSEKVGQDIIKDMERLMNNPIFRKYLLSCRVLLSIKFGSTNFIEISTPLCFQDFCITRFVDLLLLLEKSGGN